ncbi:MAG: hypothetical protein PVJ49_02975 [Acidobacteriota bacterium]|jgi:hypothetical protein
MVSRSASLVVALALAASAAQNAAPQQADFSGLDPFFAVAELLAADQQPPQAAWDAMFATPGYRTLEEHDLADRFFQRLLPLALSPSRATDAEDAIAAQPVTGMFIGHLRAAFERRAELAAFRLELEGQPLADEALATAQAWLPEGSSTRFGPPALSFVIYQPDARGYERIVMDLLLAFERQDIFPALLAHETHHVIRRQIQGAWEKNDLPEANLLAALDNLQAEGVADMIDKQALLAIDDWGDDSVDTAYVLMTGRIREELARVQQRLAELDEVLAAYAADPAAAEELGARLRQEILLMGGHPVGYHMAGVVVAAGGRERLIANVADPFDFVRAYDEVAAADPEQLHVFSDEAMRGLAMLERAAPVPQ